LKTAIFIFAILGFALTATNNSLDTCLKGIKETTHETFQATSSGLTKNWLDMAKQILESGADAIQNYEDCKKVQLQDGLDWVTGNTSPQVQTCITFVGIAAINIKQALATKDMKDIVNAVTGLDTMMQSCLLD